jgi:hypothetical protein
LAHFARSGDCTEHAAKQFIGRRLFDVIDRDSKDCSRPQAMPEAPISASVAAPTTG